MRYRRVLFDLDGTLTDSGEGIMNSARYAFEQLGYAVPDAQALRTMVGPPLSCWSTCWGRMNENKRNSEEKSSEFLLSSVYIEHQ